MGKGPLKHTGFNSTAVLRHFGRSTILLLILVISGCAVMDRQVNFLYQPAGTGRGGSGALHISQSVQPSPGKGGQMKWIIGETRNNVTQDTANIVTSLIPAETVLDAFAREFSTAGYQVEKVDSLPEGVQKGIRITGVSFRLDELDKIYGVETRCVVKVSFEPWRDGSALKRVDYQSSSEDSAYINRYNILEKALQTTLQELLERAVRETTVLLEQ